MQKACMILIHLQREKIGSDYLTGKLMSVPGPQYFKAARSYALAAASSSSYAPTILNNGEIK